MKNIETTNRRAIQAAYYQILSQAKQQILILEEVPLRSILEREDEPNSSGSYIVHELINPLIYIRLEAHKNDLLAIHYGYDQSELYTQYYPVTSAFIRSIYWCTAKENTEINIEDCVHTDWIITNCSELYEYMEDYGHHHKHYVLSYKNEVLV